MKYSVIIPCYNASTTIATTLASLQAQKRNDFEVIVVDDASQDFDALLEAIKPYRTKLNIVVLRNSVNMNGAHARNRGIKAAAGTYIDFLDADDSWTKNRLDIADQVINDTPFARFVAYGRFELLRGHSSGAILPLRQLGPQERVADYVFAAGQHMQTSTFLCPTSVAKEILFDETLTRHQDSDFMMRAQALGVHIVFQACKCAFYNFRPGDMQQRVQSGRINLAFCENWLRSKHVFFSRRAINGYRLTTQARVAGIEIGRISFIRIACKATLGLGFSNLLDLLKTKAVILYKTRLGL